jgi:hypothetical protein
MTTQTLEDNRDSERIESTPSTAGQPEPVGSAPVRPEVHVNDADAALCYANFCRVTGTPEELILDFGLNSQPMGAPTSIAIQQRLVVNYFTAKRLLQALAVSIQRHEHAFGVLETDIQKRVSPSLRRAGAPA